jgi:hypothetical protein
MITLTMFLEKLNRDKIIAPAIIEPFVFEH